MIIINKKIECFLLGFKICISYKFFLTILQKNWEINLYTINLHFGKILPIFNSSEQLKLTNDLIYYLWGKNLRTRIPLSLA